MAGEHITQEQADEYAIGSLESRLERAVALHLAECPSCRDIVRDSERLAATFALSTPRRSPPRHLRSRVFTAAGISRPGPLRRLSIVARAAAGVAAVFVAIAAFTGMLTVRDQVGDLRQANDDLQTQIDDALSQKVELAVLTRKLDDQEAASLQLQQAAKSDRDLFVALLSPLSDVAEVTAQGDHADERIGRLVWDATNKRVWFVASELARRPDGETYQIWVNSGGKYVSLGTFRPDESGFARYDTIVPEGIESYDSAVVTIEPAGGSPTRSGPTVFFVTDLSRLRN